MFLIYLLFLKSLILQNLIPKFLYINFDNSILFFQILK